MKNFVLALALTTTSGDYASVFVAPGVYTKHECATVKAMMDRDRWGIIGSDDVPLSKVLATASCIDTTKLPNPTTGGPDEMVK